MAEVLSQNEIDALLSCVAEEEVVFSDEKTVFQKELESLINKHSMENESDTPDFLLAEYLIGCLYNFAQVVKSRDNWYK